MKHWLLIVFSAFAFSGYAQQRIDADAYDLKKLQNKIDPNSNFQIIESTKKGDVSIVPQYSAAESSRSGNDCGCYIEPDSSYTLAMGPNDDLSTAVINLAFNFCFYGTLQDSVYINTNGNISFGTPYSTFSGTSFPSSNFVMVAPFWGDVDTRFDQNGIDGGEIWYKLTPTALIVNWVDVGYYSRQNDKRNTFQLIITNGADPLIPNGNNVAFCYKDMQWTTGAASQGVGGFGGVPATVGANLGNGVDYIQFGRFDTAGTIYDGPYGNEDGISWLDYQTMYFNACNSTNTPPIVTGLNSCDTIGVCRGDTLVFDMSFISPEQNQTTTITVLSTFPGVTILNNTPGVNATLNAYVVGSLSNTGFHNFQLMAIDDGIPAETTLVDLVVFVDSTIINPIITSPDSTLCIGDSTILNIGNGYDSYAWSTGTNDTTDIVAYSGLYTVTITKGFCIKSTAQFYVATIDPQPIINDDSLCTGDSLELHTQIAYDSVLWSTGDTTSSIFITVPDTYGIVVNHFGCIGSDSVIIGQVPKPQPSIFGDSIFCHLDSVLLSTQNWPTVLWSNGDTNNPTTMGEGINYVTVWDSNNCRNTDTLIVQQLVPNASIYGDTVICNGNTTTINGLNSSVSYLWNTGDTTPTILADSGFYSLTVTDYFGCMDSASTVVLQGINPLGQFTSTPSGLTFVDQNVIFTDLSTISNGTIVAWTWSFGDNSSANTTNTNHTYHQVGQMTVQLTVVSNVGCVYSLSKTIEVIDELDGPNVITPNGDFVNDYLVFSFLDFFPPATLQIYNRWGGLIYESNQYFNEWDANGVASGTYYYILTIPEEGLSLKKTLTILRD